MITIEEKQTVKVPGVTSLFVSFDYKKEVVDEIKALEGTQYNAETRVWECPISILAELLDKCCKYDEFTLSLLPDKLEFEEHLDISNFRTKPFDYQQAGIEFGLTHDCFLLLDAPGLGKTLQLTYLAEELQKRENLQHCLIICGINTLKTNWKTEIEKHSRLSCRILGQRVNRKGQLVVDGIDKRLEQLLNPIEEFFVITNVETLRNEKILAALKKNKYNKFDMVVIDEIHRCKSHTSQQGKNLLKLTTAKHRIGATGTLVLNNPLDTYVPLKWIGAERANFTNFRFQYCNYGGPFNNMLIGFKNMDALKSQIEQYSLRRTKDILNLPPQNFITEYVELNDEQRIFYDNVQLGIAQEVDKVKLRPANVLAMVGRLRQATACPSILTTANILSSKLERAEDLTEQILSSGYKVVIFSTFKETVNQLARNLALFRPVVVTGDTPDFEREKLKEQFQTDPNTTVFIGTWQACGTGITLTAASYLIFIDTPFTHGDFQQCADRIYRIGTKESVFIYNLVAANTIDERVLEIVNDKEAISDYIVDDMITEKGINTLRKYIEGFI